MKSSKFDNIVSEFIKIVKNFRKNNIISKNDLENYRDSNLHSWLQYALIKSGEKHGLLSIPEVKIIFKKPIDPAKYNLKGKRRKRYFSKVDVAFYDNKKNLVGISEVFTLDSAHGCLPTKKLAENEHYWLTPRDSLLHLFQHAKEKPKFIILVVTLLKRYPHSPPWRTKIEEIDTKLKRQKDNYGYCNYYEVFKPYWMKFKEKISREKIKNALIIISEVSENGIEKI